MSYIYDRTKHDPVRVRTLRAIGWSSMTAENKKEWAGEVGTFVSADNKLMMAADGIFLVQTPDGCVRGAYNPSDLNRVEEAVEDLDEAFSGATDDLKDYCEDAGLAWDKLYDVPFDQSEFGSMTVKTDWDYDDVPTTSDMTRYLNNVKKLRNAVPAQYPSLPSNLKTLKYNKANAIEKTLKIADDTYTAIAAANKTYIDHADAWQDSGCIACGVLNCGMI